MQILDGKIVAEQRQQALKERVGALTKQFGTSPGLAVVLVGDDKASQVYVGKKIKACQDLGIRSTEVRLPASATESQLKARIDALNSDSAVHAMLVQLPLPSGLDSRKAIAWILPSKDADCLTMENLGRLWAGEPRTLPCTPAGVMEILKYYEISVDGKNAVVVGRSQIVGKPMAHLLSQANATVTICHSKTKDLRAHLKNAEIVVVAAGKPEFLGADDFAPNAVVIDVGVHRIPNGEKTKLVGDVRFKELKVRAASPVPGGVGPMTVTMLMENTVRLFEAALGG